MAQRRAFFNSTSDGGHVRIHVPAPGVELLANCRRRNSGWSDFLKLNHYPASELPMNEALRS
jgi:hypothetical protein